MNKFSEKDLKKKSFELRKKIIEISYLSKAHHIGSELSCIDILCSLFHNYINLDLKDIYEKNSDIFILQNLKIHLLKYI